MNGIRAAQLAGSLTVIALGCSPAAAPDTSSPSASSPPAAPAVGVRGTSSPSAVGPSAAPWAAPGATSSAPRRWVARRGSTEVRITEGAGVLVDSTAPPPPPGAAPGRHPALTASCSGDPLGCSKAGEIVRAAGSADQAVAGLGRAGFTIDALPKSSPTPSASGPPTLATSCRSPQLRPCDDH